MTIEQVHNYVRMLLDMAQTGYFSPAETDMALHLAQIRTFNNLLPLYGTDSKVRQSLEPFKTATPFEMDEDGQFTGPADCANLLLVRLKYMDGEKPRTSTAPVLRDDEADARINSQLRKPTNAYPVVEDLGDKNFRLYPTSPGGGDLHYLALPKPPIYATIGDDQTTFDPANSRDMLWNDLDLVKIIFDALSSLGIALDNNMLIQVGTPKAQGA